jgi:cytochrome c oxidase subunit II
MNNKGLTLTEILISAGVIIVLGIGGYYIYSNNSITPQEVTNEDNNSQTVSSPVPAPGFEDVDEMIVNDDGDKMMVDDDEVMIEEPSDTVKSFDITAKQWEFIPNRIEVNKGDSVTLFIASIDVNHGIGIPDFGVFTALKPGQTTEVQFIADKAGTYTFFCNVQCGSGHRGMTGTLIVN